MYLVNVILQHIFQNNRTFFNQELYYMSILKRSFLQSSFKKKLLVLVRPLSAIQPTLDINYLRSSSPGHRSETKVGIFKLK